MLELNVENLEIVQKEIEEIDKLLSNISEFYQGPALKVMKRVFTDIFRTEGAAAGQPRWAPLKTSTKIARYNRFYRSGRRGRRPSRKILWDTGRLRKSYVQSPVINISKNIMRIGSNVHYGKYHETGTRYMPARPVLGRAQAIAGRRLIRAFNKEYGKKFKVVFAGGLN